MAPPVPDPVKLAREVYEAWLGEVESLRFVPVPDASSGPGLLRETLLHARARLDRLEEIYSLALAQRGGFRRKAREMEDAAGDAWDEIAGRASQTGRGARDYEGTQERYARFNLDNLDNRRAARQWRLAADMAEEITERIRLAYYGLRDSLADYRESLRSFTLESSLDR